MQAIRTSDVVGLNTADLRALSNTVVGAMTTDQIAALEFQPDGRTVPTQMSAVEHHSDPGN